MVRGNADRVGLDPAVAHPVELLPAYPHLLRQVVDASAGRVGSLTPARLPTGARRSRSTTSGGRGCPQQAPEHCCRLPAPTDVVDRQPVSPGCGRRRGAGRSGSARARGRRSTAGVVEHQRRQPAGGDHRHVDGSPSGPTMPRSSGSRRRRPGRRSRTGCPTAAPRRCCGRSPSAAEPARPGAAGRPAQPSASTEISMPGAIAPPRYSPLADTASKVVAVPKSTTIARAAVQLDRRQRVDHPVGADLLGVVGQHGYAGAHPGLDDRPPARRRSSGGTCRASRAAPPAPSSTARCRRPRRCRRSACWASSPRSTHRDLVGGAVRLGGRPASARPAPRRRTDRARCACCPTSIASSITRPPQGDRRRCRSAGWCRPARRPRAAPARSRRPARRSASPGSTSAR